MARVGPQDHRPKKYIFCPEGDDRSMPQQLRWTFRAQLYKAKYIRCYADGDVEMYLCGTVALVGPLFMPHMTSLMHVEYRWNDN
jgi:hypothetical protein